jgi:hypothetical protein
MEHKNPLYNMHVAAGGRMVPFSAMLPVQYETGVIASTWRSGRRSAF